MSAMTLQDVLLQYQGRLRELQASVANARLHSSAAGFVMSLALVLALMLGISAFRQQVSFWWPSVPVPFAALSARRYRNVRRSGERMSRLQKFYRRAVRRIEGDWAGTGATGEEFNERDHAYASDLNIFGEGSLFELLCNARTYIGQRGLASYLLEAPAPEETLLRQDVVRELRNRADIRERIASLGEFEFLESKWSTFEDWLQSTSISYPKYLRPLAALTSFLVALTVSGGLTGFVPWVGVAMWIAPLLAFHFLVGLVFRKRVNAMQEWARPISVETQVFRQGLQLLEGAAFQSVKLRKLADEVRHGAEYVRSLERLLNALNERQKEWFYLPSLALLAGTQLCMAIEQWRRTHAHALRTWLRAWAEFEALNALAAYACEHPANTFPEFVYDDVCFEARQMGHPLLTHPSCVVNDAALNRKASVYILSGSNMSGKSTLLRAIGLNAVLAAAGAPVHATALRISPLSVFASMSVADSLLSGKSKFMAEADRLRQTIGAALGSKPVLFLVDEIFSGTNSRDRRVAAEAVVRTLVEHGAIGALSTHDLSLCEIADDPDLRGINVHMGSDGAGPLSFDYRLKPGITRETNALAIARMAGVPV